MKDDLTGPALGGTQERWDGREELLYAWIRNSQAVISSGDEYSVNLYNQWNKTLMNPFPNLTDDEIASIMVYIDGVYTGTYGAAAEGADGAAAVEVKRGPNKLLYLTLLVILGLLTLIMARIIRNLNYLSEVKEGTYTGRPNTLSDILMSKGVIGFVLFALVLLGGYTTVNKAIDLGRQQGYTPEQPIKFSHVTHAGIHKIDCQYCHDGARRSKHAVIPAANTCMNCHRAIKKGSTYGTEELTKIYASIGYDPNRDRYMEDYENMPEDSIKAVYSKWIADNYMKDYELEEFDEDVEEEVDYQWNNIVSSLTNDLKPGVPGPIEWVRIHNLPDHVYFNHSQHVDIGKIDCQQCHGPVEEMDVIGQYSPLSMGWCVNCHRQTDVKFSGNTYYDVYKNLHKEIKEGKRTNVTVEDIGGLECQKCHY
jgi:hypothetical protein